MIIPGTYSGSGINMCITSLSASRPNSQRLVSCWNSWWQKHCRSQYCSKPVVTECNLFVDYSWHEFLLIAVISQLEGVLDVNFFNLPFTHLITLPEIKAQQ